MIRTIFSRPFIALFFLYAIIFSVKAEVVFNMANLSDIDSLDPHLVSGQREDRILGDIFMGLTTEAKDGSVIPGAAESWAISKDGTVYTFKIRAHNWSDGKPVTANDFEFSMRRVIKPETKAPYASVLYPIKNAEALNTGKIKDINALGVEAVDPHTLKVTLETPTPYFLSLLTHYSLFPVSQHAVELYGDMWSEPKKIVTNGAYKIAEWVKGTHVKAIKNSQFYDIKNVSIDTIYYHLDNSLPRVMQRFHAGEIDVVPEIPVDQFNELKNASSKEIRISPYQGVYYYAINVTKAPFNDKRVRQALSMAIDRSVIADDILEKNEMPAYSIVPPGTRNYGEPSYVAWKDMSYEKRLKNAKNLLKKAGIDAENPLNLTIIYNKSGGWEMHQKIADAITKMWEPLNVKATVLNAEVEAHYAKLRAADFDIARAGWIADYDDPHNFLFLLQTSSGVLNYGQYSNSKFDNLMRQASKITDLDKRAKVLAKAEAIAMEEQAVIPIFYYVTKQVVSKDVLSWVNNIADVHRARWLSVQR